MKVYLLTEEPYHDNSSVIGVYTDKELALEGLKQTADPNNAHSNDYELIEWDITTQKRTKRWIMQAKQIEEKRTVSWSSKEQNVPVRTEFTFKELE